VLEPADKAPSKCAVREDVWVRIPPAAPRRADQGPACLIGVDDDHGHTDGVSYAYLLGAYLGDGWLTSLPRGVWKLRVAMDNRYPEIIARCAAAMVEVSGRKVGIGRRVGSVELYAHWKHWRCFIPQHGDGPKHRRRIVLASWQTRLVESYPRSFAAGLIHSDGCRVINRVGRRKYEYPRYFFTNHSADIRELFVWVCRLVGAECRQSNAVNISVAKRASVAILDAFVGPKQ
jgi:hypothetical protein